MLVLASASKARHRLLVDAGIPHQIKVSGIDESQFDHSAPSRLVSSLALAKASAVSSMLLQDELLNVSREKVCWIIGCDSVFVFQGEVFGKPKDSTEACERWKRMSSKSGFLYTGHTLLRLTSLSLGNESAFKVDKTITDVIKTRLKFATLSDFEIQEYVSTGEPLNCAGGFALEGKGAMFITQIEGCYSNVIGLSLPWLRDAFLRLGLTRSFHETILDTAI